MINRNSPEYEKETVILAQIDLTTGSIPKTLLRFAFPMICGNLLQQLYNVADTLIVGRFLGSETYCSSSIIWLIHGSSGSTSATTRWLRSARRIRS